jgi:hypothetical protein
MAIEKRDIIFPSGDSIAPPGFSFLTVQARMRRCPASPWRTVWVR